MSSSIIYSSEKRGPGRPRKIKSPQLIALEADKPKRGRGRPKGSKNTSIRENSPSQNAKIGASKKNKKQSPEHVAKRLASMEAKRMIRLQEKNEFDVYCEVKVAELSKEKNVHPKAVRTHINKIFKRAKRSKPWVKDLDLMMWAVKKYQNGNELKEEKLKEWNFKIDQHVRMDSF